MSKFLNSPDFLSFLFGAAAFVVVVLIWSALVDKDPLEDRLKSIAERRNEFEKKTKKKNTRRAALQRISLMKRVVEWLRLSQSGSISEIRLKLRRAGYQSRDAIFVFLFFKLVFMMIFAALAAFFVFVIYVSKIPPAAGLLVVLVAAALGWLLPEVAVKNQSQRREEILRKAMPDALDLMVICAEAGLSLDAAFDRVSKEIGANCPELAEEIGITAVELNFLPDRSKALHGLAERVPLPSVIALVNTLIQTERYGTPLAQALRILSAEMREERMMRAEEKASRLPAILTVPMILFILPPLFVVLIGPAALKVSMAMAAARH